MKKIHLQHLYWRSGFGLSNKEFQEIKSFSKSKLILQLFKQASHYNPLELDLSEFLIFLDQPTKSIKKELGEKQYRELKRKSQRKVRDLNQAWIERLCEHNNTFREKMTLFWANVFVCRDNNIFFIQQYNNTLRKHALGNFREFVKAIAKEPSMSKYLNNRQNKKKSPNENFARELMELFTLGVGNYTEKDIKESARAFTGWSFNKKGKFYLRKKHHDYGKKTFFGKTGNFDGDEIIDIILNQKQCAKYICEKIYTYFINPRIDKKRLEEITTIFYKDYDIEKVMKHIFLSKWFYDDKNIGVKIKSPIELIVGINTIVPVTFQKKKQLNYLQKMMGQVLLYPNNVSGWKGGRFWIDSNTLMFRMKLPSLILNNAIINLEEKGEFEDDFNMYYKQVKKRTRYLKISKNWNFFLSEYSNLTYTELKEQLIISKIDEDTNQFLNNLNIKSKKNYCIQLMSIPEYQLC
ncbi:DUF1800 domain-containing protein [Polaribacter aquimarinus]|uniref:DUF1800 domain-containing protein n=1 Tax=Polaribacter aquimarinus TaxID=2100726 RepID=A0A2U2J880_9FLAO|nr:DUF1800 domain-containing protein [Polaribacter aquimarinus]PWG04546.1 DUF1800 domain-containing protein [Polaribacter aquimarinus]